MDDAVMTRLYGYHGNRTEDVYNATRFAERRYAATGVDGYNRMLAGELERVDNDFPRPYGPSVDDWVDERDKVPEERRVDEDYRNNRFFTGATSSAAAGERGSASGVEQQAWRTGATSASYPFAAGAMRRDLQSRVLSGLPSGVVSGLSAGHTPASRHIGNVRWVVNRPASPVVTLWSPGAMRRGVPDIASDAVVTERSPGVKGKDEKDDIDQRNADGLAARIKADIRQHVDAQLRRHLTPRT